jgi:aryl-alcohol dehydrogenase-like predicted oxidoreductase
MPGVTTALVGMSRLAHVEENLALAVVPPLEPEKFDELFPDTPGN